MAKAINWPQQYRDEILSEGCDIEQCAVRIGTLYYEHRYWVSGEVVDIRVNHLRIRKGVIEGDLKSCAIKELDEMDFQKLRKGMQSKDELIRYLGQTYNQPVNENTLLTLVCYKNLPIDSELIETAS